MKLLILDGNSIINRTFYGIRMLNAPDGTPTNGIYGFVNILRKLLADEKPEAVCVAFDLKGPTFRHEQYEGYKAQRKPMPEDLAAQMPLLKEVLDDIGIHRLELSGWEADDLIGTVSRCCNELSWDCVVVTGDKDSFQLITDRTVVKHVKSRMGRTETIDYTPAVFQEEYGFAPRQIIDLKALMGDPSDNIPGVRGVGEKTAMGLIQTYGTVEKIYADLDSLDVTESVRKKLREGKEDASLSFSLATIDQRAPIDFSPESCLFHGDWNGATGVFKRLGFFSMIEKWGLSERIGAEAVPAPSSTGLPFVELDEAGAEALLKRLEKNPLLALLPKDNDLNVLELCDGEACYSASRLGLGSVYVSFLERLFSPHIHKLSHNNKDFMGQILSQGLEFDGFIFDTALAAYLLAPTESGYAPERLAQKYLGTEQQGAEAVFALFPVLRETLQEEGMAELYETIELPLCRTIARMEQAGFLTDRRALEEYGNQLSKDIDGLQREIFALAGEEFNINSPKQLGEFLFEKRMLPSGRKTKTGWSTNADVLEKLRGKDPIIDKILEYRQLTKLKSTYADGLMKVIGPDGRIHSNFQMTVTATGRLSSTEPNLQNIPVRTELGAKLRDMFVAPAGKLLVDADYSQIELRLLAHISGDSTMIAAFREGEDIHTVTASQVFGLPLGEVTKRQRSSAKAVNFGIVYGISAFSLAQDIGVFQSEAKAYIDTYLQKYSGVRDYMHNIVEKAKAEGYVTTLFGRKRPLPELKSANFQMRAFGERVALNTPIQGTAADVIKLAMVNVDRRMEREALSARLILQVHDELIAECPEEEAETVRAILREEMENAVAYTVPLEVDVNIGKSWGEAK